jgi:DNA mismatch repair protein MutH
MATGRLELDIAGRIIGMEILWSPTETSESQSHSQKEDS